MSALKKVVFDVIRQIRHCKKVQGVVLDQLYVQLLGCALQEGNNMVSVLKLILSKSCKTWTKFLTLAVCAALKPY